MASRVLGLSKLLDLFGFRLQILAEVEVDNGLWPAYVKLPFLTLNFKPHLYSYFTCQMSSWEFLHTGANPGSAVVV